MRLMTPLILVLVLLAAGCCCLPSSKETTTTTVKTTTTKVTMESQTTIATTTTIAATTTTLFTMQSPPAYNEGDKWSYTESITESSGKPYESSMTAEYRGKSDNGQDIIKRFFNGAAFEISALEEDHGSSALDYYRVTDNKWVLEKTSFYTKGSNVPTTGIYNPGRIELTFPLYVGQNWNGFTEIDVRHAGPTYNIKLNYSSRVRDYKDVPTTAGTFKCFEIETVEYGYFQGKLAETRNFMYYYCPDLKYYGAFNLDVTLPSGEKRNVIRLPQSQMTLTLIEGHKKTVLKEYRIT